jgi:ethanolamine permease
LIVSAAYFCLSLSLAEISSCLPFSGGSYALARVTGGPIVGFIVGCADRVDLLASSARSLIMTGWIITSAAGLKNAIYPALLIWIVSYAIMVVLLWKSAFKKYFWRSMIFGLVCYGVLLTIFIIACGRNAHFGDGLDTSHMRSINGLQFLQILPACTLFYGGIHFVQMGTMEIQDPKKNMPICYVSGVCIAFIIGIILLFLVASHAPVYIMPGSQMIWTIIPALAESLHTKEIYLALLMLPSIYSAFRAHTYATQRVMVAMTQSKLSVVNFEYYFRFFTLDQIELLVAARDYHCSRINCIFN